jgi:AGCS family alanine or glycine:cation symporter
MTALIVITTLYAQNGVMVQALENPSIADGIDKSNMVQTAISTLFANGNVGNIIGAVFVAVCLSFFAFSTIISWNLFGRINFEYLFGKKSSVIYSVIAIVFIFLGSVFSSDLVWNFSDFFNYLMVIPNAIALFALSGMVVKELKENG